MADESYPSPGHNDRNVSDVEYERIAARFSDDGVYGDPKDTQVVSAGTGLSVTIRADVAASVRGHGWYSGAAAISVPLDANVAGQARTDWIVLRLDRSDWTVKPAIVTGTPGAGAPALTQQTGETGVYEIPLAQARVLGGASSVSVTRAELYVGTRCRPCTSTTRNPTPRISELGWETDTGRVILWDGIAWRVVYDSPSTVGIDTPRVGWNVSVGSVLEQRSGIVTLRLGTWQRTGPDVASATESMLPVLIPAAYRPVNRMHYILAYQRSDRVARLAVYPLSDTSGRSGQVWLVNHGGIARNDYLLPETGQSWVVG
ncbi:hypothetical protein CF54_03965 [Streptomyces sp. Tu 6176]|uniref:hypothetical protein n=1 Tax=Streptomyces sp. Tu 6176 TaxID=1470557 RepID=UPI00044867CB|nr:hypothetical protein [Streptomyces sp. Tu 6176]EYT84015.1 hypothetical protein CF54_03965 [Streptomyces sp. Tu 6176]